MFQSIFVAPTFITLLLRPYTAAWLDEKNLFEYAGLVFRLFGMRQTDWNLAALIYYTDR